MSRSKKFNTKYSPEFKVSAILDMREHGLTVRKYWGVSTRREIDSYRKTLRQWERMNILLKISCLPRSTYYYHLKQGKVDKYKGIKQEIEQIFTENKQRYGYRRILLALRQKGIVLNHKTVHKLMRNMGLHGKRRKKKIF